MVEGGQLQFDVPGGSLLVALHADGSVRIESLRGPELMTIWRPAPGVFLDELTKLGLSRNDSAQLFATLDALCERLDDS
jgi:hypothetical protein